GHLRGAVQLLPGGRLAPGTQALGNLAAAPGTLTTAKAAILAGTVWMRIDRESAQLNDRLAAATVSVLPEATLTVKNFGASPLQAGDTFALFNVPIQGNFKTVDLPTLANPSLAWTNKLAIDGTIAVVRTHLLTLGAASPALASDQQTTLLTVAVQGSDGQLGGNLKVDADLTLLGGAARQEFFDDGTHGDRQAGDHVYSFQVSLAGAPEPGELQMRAWAETPEGERAACDIPLTVLPNERPFIPGNFLPLAESPGTGSMPLAANGQATPIYYSLKDAAVVAVAARALRDDLQRVTGLKAELINHLPPQSDQAVIIGTIGQSELIDGMIAAGKLDVTEIKNQWEAYQAVIVTNPVAGIVQALVILGSDRRGTAYGVFSLSEAMGVSPWYWWADTPVVHHPSVYVAGGKYYEHSPGVKYRGIFINDEDWGINPWAAKTFDPAFKNIGPKTYEKVFELLLRLRLNYFWPAMHACTTEFGSIPANADLADRYGIVMGSSHCEPMLCNNVHWNETEKGRWNYQLNREIIHNYWEENTKFRSQTENVWTLGIRGIHDAGMQTPPDNLPGKIKVVGEVLRDQRALLTQYVTPQFGPVAQCFVPYKEVLPIYDAGLVVPEDVTLVWVDDNFGYIRRLSSPAERKRSGGAGVYWHISYYGGPHSYTWINTTAPALMWEELHKAWENEARTLWMLNVGDIKPMEIGIDYYARLAWRPERYEFGGQRQFLNEFAARNLGPASAPALSEVLMEFYRLGTIRKPELMNRKWALALSPARAAELEQDYRQLLAKENSLAAALPWSMRDAYTELVGFPVRVLGEAGLIFLADRKIQAGREVQANEKEIQQRRAHLEDQVRNFNTVVAGGKWNRMMPGLETEKNQKKWNSQVAWPWGEGDPVKSASATNQPDQNRKWRAAESADQKTGSDSAQWSVVEGLGASGRAMALLPATLTSVWGGQDKTAPALAYHFTSSGAATEVVIEFLPTFRIVPGM
ncbi:MAG TPA: glycosyl hydrolase 115 family protein, partial [Verrucomicrobiae bacterium]